METNWKQIDLYKPQNRSRSSPIISLYLIWFDLHNLLDRRNAMELHNMLLLHSMLLDSQCGRPPYHPRGNPNRTFSRFIGTSDCLRPLNGKRILSTSNNDRLQLMSMNGSNRWTRATGTTRRGFFFLFLFSHVVSHCTKPLSSLLFVFSFRFHSWFQFVVFVGHRNY